MTCVINMTITWYLLLAQDHCRTLDFTEEFVQLPINFLHILSCLGSNPLNTVLDAANLTLQQT